ncbi:hypothetical protein D3C84_1166140 [compost metagenome]
MPIREGDEGATIDGIFHGDTPGRQVVVQVEGFTLFEVDGNPVLIVGVIGCHPPQIPADHQ